MQPRGKRGKRLGYIFGLGHMTKLVCGWCMVLGKLLVPGRPTNLENSKARAYCAYIGCG